MAGIGHDGGAAWGDAVFGLKKQEAGKELVDRDRGLELGETGSEGGGEIDGCVLMLGEMRVGATKERLRVGDKQAAAGAVDEAMVTATFWRYMGQRRNVGGIRVSVFLVHFDPR